jgi:hypothetical protein
VRGIVRYEMARGLERLRPAAAVHSTKTLRGALLAQGVLSPSSAVQGDHPVKRFCILYLVSTGDECHANKALSHSPHELMVDGEFVPSLAGGGSRDGYSFRLR